MRAADRIEVVMRQQPGREWCSAELAAELHVNHYTVRWSLRELRLRGVAHPVGERPTRPANEGGNPARLWALGAEPPKPARVLIASVWELGAAV